MVGAPFALAADDYSTPRNTTAENRDNGLLGIHDNATSAFVGCLDDLADFVWGTCGWIGHNGGMGFLLLSDVAGVVDDNPVTRHITHGWVSENLALAGLHLSDFGTQMIEVPHGLDLSGWPPKREWYLNADDGGDGWDSIDYVHYENGWDGLIRIPCEAVAILLSNGAIRPAANIMRFFSIEAADDVEETGIKFVEMSLCAPNIAEDAREVVREVPVIEIREVPVETEVVREVFRTVVTQRFTFRDVLFAHDSAELTDLGNRVCDQIATVLRDRDISDIMVNGHTNDLGTDEYNMELGQRRADSVAAALAERGLPGDVMQTISHGEADPIVPNDSDVNRALNRRVEVQVTYVEDNDGSM
jgi:outer membrane protein OmpA-like peptidoglycan-associated protein